MNLCEIHTMSYPFLKKKQKKHKAKFHQKLLFKMNRQTCILVVEISLDQQCMVIVKLNLSIQEVSLKKDKSTHDIYSRSDYTHKQKCVQM